MSMYNSMDKKEQEKFDKSFDKLMWKTIGFLALIAFCCLLYAGYNCITENIIPNLKHILR